MKLKQKILALACLAALGAGSAQAATTNGTVTITGTAVVSCTLNIPTVDFGATVPAGRGPQSKQFTVDVDCPTGTAWSLSATNAPTTITIGTNTTGNNATIMNSAGTSYINGAAALTGTGTSAAQTQTLLMKLQGGASGLIGTGAISGSVPITLTY